MKVLDQFGKPLANFYNGTAVREDGGWIAWMGDGSYEDPLWTFHNGTTENTPDPLLLNTAGQQNTYNPISLPAANNTDVWSSISSPWINIAGHDLGALRSRLLFTANTAPPLTAEEQASAVPPRLYMSVTFAE